MSACGAVFSWARRSSLRCMMPMAFSTSSSSSISGRYLLFAQDIGAVLTDGWQDYPRDPVLEGRASGLSERRTNLYRPVSLTSLYLMV